MNSRNNTPLFSLVIIMSLGMGCIMLFQILKQQDLYFVGHKYFLGYDYIEFYKASLLVIEGKNPYSIDRYVTPPIPAIFNIPFTYIPFELARVIVSIFILLSVVLSLLLIHRVFNSNDRQGDWLFILGILIILGISYPFYFLFDRGNIDGFVLLLMCLGLFYLGKYDSLAGAMFALAISFKVYPTLVIIPLIGQRRWKLLFFIGVVLIFLFLLTPKLWAEFLLKRIFVRSSIFFHTESGSIATTFFYIGHLFNLAYFFKDISFLVYLTLLGTVCYLDFKKKSANNKELCARLTMYLPFMVAVPQLSFHYELVCILSMMPAVSWLWRNTTQALGRRLLTLIVVGLALSQFQAVAAEKLIGKVYPHFIPGFGLLIVIIGVTAYKLLEIWGFSIKQDFPGTKGLNHSC